MSDDELEPNEERLSESEFLDQQSRVASEGLSRLRGEIVESLRRSADPVAWTVRYPLQSLAAAALAGVGAGVAMGRATRGRADRETADEAEVAERREESAEDGDHPRVVHVEQASLGPWGKLLGGLGTVLGAMASTAGIAATRAVAEIVRETIHDSLRPEAEPETNGHPAAEGE